MIDTPELFVAETVHVTKRPWKAHALSEVALFRSGWEALGFTLSMVTGCTWPGFLDGESSHVLEYLDGPDDPMLDEGFQLYRIADDPVQKLAGRDPQQLAAMLSNWQEFAGPEWIRRIDLEDLDRSMNQLVCLARIAQATGGSLMVTILFR